VAQKDPVEDRPAPVAHCQSTADVSAAAVYTYQVGLASGSEVAGMDIRERRPPKALRLPQ